MFRWVHAAHTQSTHTRLDLLTGIGCGDVRDRIDACVAADARFLGAAQMVALLGGCLQMHGVFTRSAFFQFVGRRATFLFLASLPHSYVPHLL